MKNRPMTRVNLDRVIARLAGNDPRRIVDVRMSMANAIVGQLLPEGVVKGGTSLKFRFGEEHARYTLDLDTAWKTDLDTFLANFKKNLHEGWEGFSGDVVIRSQMSPTGVPFEYVMQPCDVKLNYKELCFPAPGALPLMKLPFQIAQKLHGATGERSRRAHDLIDLQLIVGSADVDLVETQSACERLFRYRKCQPWPPKVAKREGWDEIYATQKMNLPVLPTVDEAIEWTNNLIAKIVAAGRVS